MCMPFPCTQPVLFSHSLCLSSTRYKNARLRYFEQCQPEALSLSFSLVCLCVLSPHLSFNSLHNYNKRVLLMNIQFCLRLKNNVDSLPIVISSYAVSRFFWKAQTFQSQGIASMCWCRTTVRVRQCPLCSYKAFKGTLMRNAPQTRYENRCISALPESLCVWVSAQ